MDQWCTYRVQKQPRGIIKTVHVDRLAAYNRSNDVRNTIKGSLLFCNVTKCSGQNKEATVEKHIMSYKDGPSWTRCNVEISVSMTCLDWLRTYDSLFIVSNLMYNFNEYSIILIL